MNLKLLIPFVFGLGLTGLMPALAQNPEGTPCTDAVIPAETNAVNSPFEISASSHLPVNESEIRAGLLYDAVNGKVIWQKNISTAYPIASLTKMMVAFLAVEDVRAGKFSWTDNVKWSREIVVGRRRHKKKIISEVSYTLKDVFKAAMIASNNECAEQMARFIGGGNLQATIERMNTRANQLGMMSTYYGNPTGLPAPHMMFDNAASPSDLLILTLEMLKYNEVVEIASMGYAAIENGKCVSTIRNHNSLTIEYSGEVDGLKTGYTKRAGFCLVATSAKCDHRLVSIVLGCRGPQIRNEIVRNMINDYYTSIGLDRLGPQCPSPLNPTGTFAQANTSNGRYITVNESVKKIHVVKKGESISKIAARYNCTTAQIKSWNKKSIRNNTIASGQRIALYVKQPRSIFIQDPVNGNEAEDDKPLITQEEKKNIVKAGEQADEETPVVEKAAAIPPVKYLYHIVAPGDTLFKIAQRYQGSVEELKTLNKITDSRNLKAGTKIKVRVKA